MNVEATWKIALCALCIVLNTHAIRAQDCAISNPILTAQECVNGEFFLELHLSVDNPAGEEFGVVGNMTFFGYFAYTDLPITIGPLVGDGMTDWNLVFFDRTNVTCQLEAQFGAVECCGFANIEVTNLPCDNTEEFSIELDFDLVNTGVIGFGAYDLEGNLLNIFPYTQRPVKVSGIPSSGIGEDGIVICDFNDSNCCTRVDIAGPDCDPTNCEIYLLSAEPQACDRGEFNVLIDFVFENGSDEFTITGNGNSYGSFEYDDLPVLLGPFVGDGETVYEFSVFDNAEANCGDAVEVGTITCTQLCAFREAEVTPVDCQGDVYSVSVDFAPISVGNQGFAIYANDNLLGQFSYDDVPVLIDSFPASGQFFDSLTICDDADTACCEITEFQALLCQDCIIYDLSAERTACDSNGQFMVSINFKHQNTGVQGFQVGGNGVIYGQFTYSDLPIKLGPFDGDDSTNYEFAVFDSEDGLCIDGVVFGPVNCIDPCVISDLTAITENCTGDGTYALTVIFNHEHTDETVFSVYANDELFGTFAYTELPLAITDFPASGNLNDRLTVCGNKDPFCCASNEFLSPGCFEECDLRDLAAVLDSCTSDSTFGAIFNFIFDFFDSNSVTVVADGRSLGEFVPDSGSIAVSSLPSDADTISVVICETGNPFCCDSVRIKSFDCNTTCKIENLTLANIICSNDGTLAMHVFYTTDGVISDQIEVTLDGELLGSFQTGVVPIQLTGIAGNAANSTLTICDATDNTCCASINFLRPVCKIDSCSIRDLAVLEFACRDDGTFSAIINVIPEGVASEQLMVFQDGELIDSFQRMEIPFQVEGLVGTGEGTVLRVCGATDTSCCTEIIYSTPFCPLDTCDVRDLEILEFDCLDNGTFSLTATVTPDGIASPYLRVWHDGDEQNPVRVEDLPFALPGIEGNGNISMLTVCDSLDPDCCTSVEYMRPVCEISCTISNLQVQQVVCADDGTFSGNVLYSFQGFDNDSIDLMIDSEIIGRFPAGQPIPVEGYEGNGQFLSIKVCEAGNDDCCQTISYRTVECEGCAITGLSAEIIECTSDTTYGAWLDFNTTGFDTTGLNIFANGAFIGFFPLVTPILVNNLPSTEFGTLVQVCSADSILRPGCCDMTEVRGPDCTLPGCPIDSLTVELTDCDANDMYEVVIDLILADRTEGSFIILSNNGQNLGVATHDEFPKQLGPFLADTTTVRFFTIFDLTDNECFGTDTVGVVNCERTGIFDTPQVYDLSIMYSASAVFAKLPKHSKRMSIYASNGSLVDLLSGLENDKFVRLDQRLSVAGVYIAQIETPDGVYVGKFVVRL